MPVSLILAHPDPDSFNHALAHTAAETCRELGLEVNFHDLYAEGFDPVLPANEIAREAALPPLVQTHCEEISTAEAIVVVHPNWWGQPPAILKGWVDRVLRPGVAYRFDTGDKGEGLPIGLLPARAALVLNTSNTPELREEEDFGDPLESLWNDCIFSFCGVQCFQRRMFRIVCTSSQKKRERWLNEAKLLVKSTLT